MNLVMAEPVKSKEEGAFRLTVAISADDAADLEDLKVKLRRVTGKRHTTQELASTWISEGIAAKKAELARLTQA